MRFGRNQWIAIGALSAPTIISTIALFTDFADFSEWGSFMQIHIPLITGIALGGSAWTKIAKTKD